MSPDVMSELCDAFEKSATGEEFVNRIMVGDCPKCGSSQTGDCENDPDIDDACVARCFACGQLWCPDCGELFQDNQPLDHDCPAWEEMDLSDADLDEILTTVDAAASRVIAAELDRIVAARDAGVEKLPVEAIREARQHRDVMVPRPIFEHGEDTARDRGHVFGQPARQAQPALSLRQREEVQEVLRSSQLRLKWSASCQTAWPDGGRGDAGQGGVRPGGIGGARANGLCERNRLATRGAKRSRYAEDVVRRKPHPDVFLEAARRLHMPAASCCVVEDAVNGVQAAKAAGMRCVAVATSFFREALVAAGADLVRPGISDVSLNDLLT